MRHLILVSLLLAALTYCASETLRDYSTYTFPQYLKEHQKSYNTTEYIFRKSLFEKKLREIITHNKNPTYSWKLGVNQFTDMTEAERRAYRGLNKALLYQTQNRRGIIPQLAEPVDPALKARLPDAVDWRTKGIITSVKNQGMCGSCWSFGAAECVESVVAQKTGSLTVLSEQNILDCTPNPHHCGGTGGCGGGTVELAWDKIKEEGIATEKDYPYKSGSTGRDYKCNTGFNVFTNISGYVNLPPNQQGPLLDALANIGPLAINVDASRWSDYGSGVFDGCNQKSPDIDHVVQLVGYGTDPKHGDYWLIRNSWGTGYGEKGYIRIRKEDTPRCGTDTKPDDGTGCDDGPPTVNVCGTCGVLFDALYPLKN